MAVVSKEGRGRAGVVSKKVARLAVTGHLIKRRVLHALRAMPIPQSLIVFPRASVVNMNYAEIKTEITALLSKIH